jgi:hypothetical protein
VNFLDEHGSHQQMSGGERSSPRFRRAVNSCRKTATRAHERIRSAAFGRGRGLREPASGDVIGLQRAVAVAGLAAAVDRRGDGRGELDQANG